MKAAPDETAGAHNILVDTLQWCKDSNNLSRIRVFMTLYNIYLGLREEATGRWGFVSALFVIHIRAIKSSRMTRAGHVTNTGEKGTQNFGEET